MDAKQQKVLVDRMAKAIRVAEESGRVSDGMWLVKVSQRIGLKKKQLRLVVWQAMQKLNVEDGFSAE